MNNPLLFIVFIFSVLCAVSSYSQKENQSSYLDGIKLDKINNIEYDKKRREYYVAAKKRASFKQLSLYFRSDDSVSIYLNDSLVYSEWIKHSETAYASYNSFVPFEVETNDNRNNITIVLNKRKRFITFKLNKRFAFVSIYYLGSEDGKYYWTITHSNNIPGC